MPYVRKKRFGNRTYYYLVEGVRVDGRVRQRVLAYLGEHGTLADALRGAEKDLAASPTTGNRARVAKLRAVGRGKPAPVGTTVGTTGKTRGGIPEFLYEHRYYARDLPRKLDHRIETRKFRVVKRYPKDSPRWVRVEGRLDISEREAPSGKIPVGILKRERRLYRHTDMESWLSPDPEPVAARRKLEAVEREDGSLEDAIRRANEDREAWSRRFPGWFQDPNPRLEAFRALGLPADSTPEQIRDRYRSLALQTHPDKGGTAEEFARVEAAYRVLNGA